MPIRPHLRGFYPIDWKQLSAVIRFERAKSCCEGCGRPHGATVQHAGGGIWLDEARDHWRDGQGRVLRRFRLPEGQAARPTKVVLATAHLDHDPGNNDARNLKALCQRCHIARMLAAVARKDYVDRRRRQAEGTAKAKAAGRYKGRAEDRKRNDGIAAMLRSGSSWQQVQDAFRCSSLTVARVKARLDAEQAEGAS